MEVRIQGKAGLQGTLQVPPDKSISHRSLIFGALAQGESRIVHCLDAEDITATQHCLRAFGCILERHGEIISVQGMGLEGFREPSQVLDCENSGTTMRLITGLTAGYPFLTVLTGDASLRNRPMARVIRPLMLMGASIEGRKNGAYAPLAIRGGNLRGIDYTLPVASAQLKSAIILAGLKVPGKTQIIEPVPTRDHTERMLKTMGAKVQTTGNTIELWGGTELKAQEFRIPGDISAAAFFLVGAALLPGSEILLTEVGINPRRIGIIHVLKKMGAQIQLQNPRIYNGEPIADLWVRHSPLKGIEIQGEILPSLIDELPILSIAMALAEGESTVKNAEELRIKETDRIAAICQNLTILGGNVEETPDGFRIQGVDKLNGGQVDSFGDHRMAMALGIAGLLASEGVLLTRAEAVKASYPSFWKDLSQLAHIPVRTN